MSTELALEVRGLSKTFGEHRALKNLELDVRPGEIHALVGENGCGKSTFVKCLSGYHSPDPGSQINIAGVSLPGSYGPEDASRMGLAFVHQDLGLIPSLSVAASLQLGKPPITGFGWRLNKRREAQFAREILGRLKRSDINPRTLISELSVATQTVVALARCLAHADQNHLLVLDEPTAALAEGEVARLFDALREAQTHGVGIIYISHRLDEIFAIADRVTVLRDGERIATHEVADITRDQLVEEIVGRELATFYPAAPPVAEQEVVLELRGVSGERVRDVSFSVRKGEVVGIAGLLGCGKSELGRLIFGDQARSSGSVLVGAEDANFRLPKHAIAAGVALVPANRHRDGIHPSESTGVNLTMLDTRKYWRGGLFRERERSATVARLIDEFDVRPRDPDKPISLLSGGNQQKAVLAKWMHRNPRVLILDEPAQGIDIGAKAQVFALLEAAAEAGMAVLVISEEFDDLVHLCDRVLVMSEGSVVADLSGDQMTRQRISTLAFKKAV